MASNPQKEFGLLWDCPLDSLCYEVENPKRSIHSKGLRLGRGIPEREISQFFERSWVKIEVLIFCVTATCACIKPLTFKMGLPLKLDKSAGHLGRTARGVRKLLARILTSSMNWLSSRRHSV